MTVMSRRTFLGGTACFLLPSVHAAEVLRVVVPYAAGGITDI